MVVITALAICGTNEYNSPTKLTGISKILLK
jgi:hypothetical protein